MLRSQTYEITFAGQADTALCEEFDDCDVAVGPGTTTLRAELPDKGALTGLLQRITCLGLEVIYLHIVAPPTPRGAGDATRVRLGSCTERAKNEAPPPPAD